MKPVENEVTFQISERKYNEYYAESCRSPCKYWDAFGVKWFLVSLERKQDPKCEFFYEQYFATFRAVLCVTK